MQGERSTEEARVARARQGDRAAREALARTWLRPVYGVALGLAGRAADAEDLTQETFYRAFRALPTLRDPSRFGPWIVRILRNVARDQGRRPRALPLGDAADRLVDEAGSGKNAGGVVEAWRRLPEEERFVFWLKVVDGMTFRDLAHLLGTSKSRVDRTFRRALARMRKETSRC